MNEMNGMNEMNEIRRANESSRLRESSEMRESSEWREPGELKEKNKVNVVIGGEIITLVSGEREEYMQKLARYIDKKIDEIRNLNSNATINERTRTLFIAVNVADDYFKAIERLRRLEDEHDRYVMEMGRMQEENLMMSEKLHELQAQLSRDKHMETPNVLSMNKRKANGR